MKQTLQTGLRDKALGKVSLWALWWRSKHKHRTLSAARCKGRRVEEKRAEQANINSTHLYISICSTNGHLQRKINFHSVTSSTSLQIHPQRRLLLINTAAKKGREHGEPSPAWRTQSGGSSAVSSQWLDRAPRREEELHTCCYTPHTQSSTTGLHAAKQRVCSFQTEPQQSPKLSSNEQNLDLTWQIFRLSTQKTNDGLNVGCSDAVKLGQIQTDCSPQQDSRNKPSDIRVFMGRRCVVRLWNVLISIRFLPEDFLETQKLDYYYVLSF